MHEKWRWSQIRKPRAFDVKGPKAGIQVHWHQLQLAFPSIVRPCEVKLNVGVLDLEAFLVAKSSMALKAWTFKSAQCSDGATCTLRKTAPKQSLAPPDGGCETFSGTTAPVRAGGLLPLQYQPLPLGTVIPRGWLRDQLVTMANGLSGHLELFWDDVHDSVWIGGTHDHSGAGHEREQQEVHHAVARVFSRSSSSLEPSRGPEECVNPEARKVLRSPFDAAGTHTHITFGVEEHR